MMLEQIVEFKKKEVAKLKNVEPSISTDRIKHRTGRFKKALKLPGISLIAETKKASPSKGLLIKNYNPAELADIYEKGGASAVSVLTESSFFKGSLMDLKQVKAKVSLPVLRKDFILDELQIYESYNAGADALLLIAAVLEEKQLKYFIQLTSELGMDALVEVHTLMELEKVLKCGAEIIGINNRDLNSFHTDISVTLEIAPHVPDECVIVSESGIKQRSDIRKLAGVGVDAVLVGEALVKSPDVMLKVRELVCEGSNQ